MMRTVSWSIHALTESTVFIADDNTGGMSVTNAAELVCEQCFERFGDRRIVYRDTEGRWDELDHYCGRFIGFLAYGGKVTAGPVATDGKRMR